MKERMPDLVEAMGAVLVVVAISTVNLALGVGLSGLLLIYVANFEMGLTESDADTDEHDQAGPKERRQPDD